MAKSCFKLSVFSTKRLKSLLLFFAFIKNKKNGHKEDVEIREYFRYNTVVIIYIKRGRKMKRIKKSRLIMIITTAMLFSLIIGNVFMYVEANFSTSMVSNEDNGETMLYEASSTVTIGGLTLRQMMESLSL